MDSPTADNFFLSTSSADNCIVYIGFDMSGSMFGNSGRNWKIQTTVITDYFQNSGCKSIQAFGWSSDNGTDNGVITCPLFVTKSLITLYLSKFTSGRMTEPSTFFTRLISYLKLNNIPTDKNITIVFLTDGVIECSNVNAEKINLKARITELKNLYPKTSVEIHVIDPGYSSSSTTELKIGKDVFNIAMDIASEEKGTGHKIITKVIVHTSSTDSHTELNQISAVDKNMLPYDNKLFLKKSEPEFRQWFGHQVRQNAKSEDMLCNMLLKLAETLSHMVKYMVPEQISLTTKSYSELFVDTDIGLDAAEMLIKNICDQALLNRTFLRKDLRMIVQKFFEESQKSLISDAHKALGFGGVKFWTSLPVNNNIFCGSVVTAEFKDLTIGKSTYKNCSVKIGYDNFIMIIPVYDIIDPIAAQCFRLYIRSNLTTWLTDRYSVKVDMSSEELIYIFGTIMFTVVMSKAPEFIKDGFRKCFKIMLQKKATSTTFITMLQELTDGKMPPGNTMLTFEKRMEIPLKMLGITDSKDFMKLWYAICLTSEIPQLAKAQYQLYSQCYTTDVFDLSVFVDETVKLCMNMNCVNVTEQVHNDKIQTECLIVANSKPSGSTSVPTPRSRPIAKSKNIIVYFRESVYDSVINQVVNHMQTTTEFHDRNIVIGTDIGPYNLQTFMEKVTAESNIVILPNSSIKPVDVNKCVEYKCIRVVQGMTCDKIVEQIKESII